MKSRSDKGEVIIYKTQDGKEAINVRLENETVWLNQAQMAALFGRDRVAITQHIGNIFKEKELEKKSVCKDFLHTAADGKIYKTQYYNLDVIISVGYRVKSKRGTQFRIWATRELFHSAFLFFDDDLRTERLSTDGTDVSLRCFDVIRLVRLLAVGAFDEERFFFVWF